MAGNAMHLEPSVGVRTRPNAFMDGFVKCAAGLLDIFRIGTGARESGTPEDDALELLGDVEAIARDFHVVLSSIESTSRK